MMSEDHFDARLKQIESEYAGAREGADAARDQEVARLFVECGWTQVRIAERMGWSEGKVSRQLVFGRFIRFLPSGQESKSPAKPLTERRFRNACSRAGKLRKETEAERFARVATLLASDASDMPGNYGNLVKKPGIKKAVIEVMSDGKRLSSAEIAEEVSVKMPGVTREQVTATLQRMQEKPPQGMALEARHVGQSHKYRLVERKRGQSPTTPAPSIDALAAFIDDAAPLVKECIKILKAPEVGRQVTLALEHLWRVEQMLSQLLVPEEVV